jgi:hypothetical protein
MNDDQLNLLKYALDDILLDSYKKGVIELGEALTYQLVLEMKELNQTLEDIAWPSQSNSRGKT